MNKKLFLITSFCFFGPFACFNCYGMDATSTSPTQSMVIQSDMVKTSDVSSAVQTAFVNDRSLAPFAGSVVVRVDSSGVVTLSGSAPSDKVKFDFENKAKSVSGVAKVVNNIEVKQVMK